MAGHSTRPLPPPPLQAGSPERCPPSLPWEGEGPCSRCGCPPAPPPSKCQQPLAQQGSREQHRRPGSSLKEQTWSIWRSLGRTTHLQPLELPTWGRFTHKGHVKRKGPSVFNALLPGLEDSGLPVLHKPAPH